jgi:hypothetical protein
MKVLLDKYGIVIDGMSNQGQMVVIHPTAPQVGFDMYRPGDEEEETVAVIPQVRNVFCFSGTPTFLGKLRFAYELVRWTFFTNYSNESN